jgi:Suppressor of fused protein (SUFU)
MKAQHSKSGKPVYVHTTRAPDALVEGDEGLIEAVGAHVERHFGEIAGVYHEIVSPWAHIDLFVVAPAKERPVTTVVTCGMSQFPMHSAKPGVERYAELCLLLPPDWPTMDDPGFESEAGYWPYRLLKQLARLPHEFSTMLWMGHTVPNGDPPAPYGPNTKLAGAMLAPLIFAESEEAGTISFGDREITLFGVWTLHADEMQYKLDHGLDALFDHLDEAKVSEIVKADRPSCVPRRRRGLFRR